MGARYQRYFARLLCDNTSCLELEITATAKYQLSYDMLTKLAGFLQTLHYSL